MPESDTEKRSIDVPLTVGMKATMGLILAFTIFLVAGSISALLVGSWDIYLAVRLVTFVPLLIVLLIFTWKAKRWAYVGTIILGGVFVVGSAALLASDGRGADSAAVAVGDDAGDGARPTHGPRGVQSVR